MTNPVARSNVCPEIDPPSVPGFHAFAYTVPDAAARGDVSTTGMRAKAAWVLGEMENRMAAMGFAWKDATATQLYTLHNIHPFLADELVRRGAMPVGLTWHFNRPPVRELEYEMDCRGVDVERVLAT